MVTVIDADGCILGRLASNVAERLLAGEEVAIVNAEKAIITGDKDEVFAKYRAKHTRGTQRKGPFYPRVPHRLVKRTVRGMIPYQKPRGREAWKRLKCYIGVPPELEGTEAESLEEAKPRSVTSHVLVEDISRYLGAKV